MHDLIAAVAISHQGLLSLPSPGSVNEYQLRLGKQRQVWLIPLADETQGVQVKLCYPLTVRAIPENLRDVSCIGAIQIDITFTFVFNPGLLLFWLLL